MKLILFVKFFIVIILQEVFGRNVSPNIILIVADDLGWNDVSFHGSKQILTPNIDALAYSGVILKNYYVQPICTPSRASLLTGFHPIHTGMNHDVIYGPEPYGLPENFKLLPQYLNDLGYDSYAIGKWHLGLAFKELTPTYRGFKYHCGYWTGHLDYYDHLGMEAPGFWGHDFRRNMNSTREYFGQYMTDILTTEAVRVIKRHHRSHPLFLYLAHLAVHSANPYAPLQAPRDIINKFSFIKDKNRRIFAAMLWKLDESVGRITKALHEANMLSNSVIIFTTDNGGPAAGFNLNAASNWPLRGVKASMWEGGIRGVAFVWYPLIKNPGRVSTNMMQIIDWLPTIYAAAGGDTSNLPTLDGINQWKSLMNDSSPVRGHMLHNIDPIMDGASVRVGVWKLLYKPSEYGPKWDGWFGPSERKELSDVFSVSKMASVDAIRESTSGTIVRLLNSTLLTQIPAIKNDAEVFCDPIPKNATKSCNDRENPCLFHITSDPCEYYDVSRDHPGIVMVLQSVLRRYNLTSVPPGNKPWDPSANPKFWNYEWTNWKDFINSKFT